MVRTFQYTREDYLSALALEKANRRQSAGIFHLMLIVGVGCIVYISLATLRQSFDRNDALAYGAAVAVTALLLVNYSPKILPTLLFPLYRRRLPAGLIGPHVFEMTEKYLAFRYGGVETRVGYVGLARVNHNDQTVLFYLQNGAVEAVPLRAMGVNTDERAAALRRIEARAKKANGKPVAEPLPPWKPDEAAGFTCPITAEDVLHCNAAHVPVARRARLADPIQWLYLAVLLLAVAGCGSGLATWSGHPQSIRLFLRVFYVLEIPACLTALLYWYQPAALVNYGVQQNFKLGRYPSGYLGWRQVEWDQEGLAFRYGVFGVSLDWDVVTAVEDNAYLYIYQGGTLVLFLPKGTMTDQITAFAAAREA